MGQLSLHLVRIIISTRMIMMIISTKMKITMAMEMVTTYLFAKSFADANILYCDLCTSGGKNLEKHSEDGILHF